MPIVEEGWKSIARDARSALELLGLPVEDQCLPDDAAPCGGSYTQHTVAYLATIIAVCEHQLAHLGPDVETMAREVHDHAATELRTSEECQLTHHHH